MNKLALISVLYDYPFDRNPIFMPKVYEYFDQNDIFVIRGVSEKENPGMSYYEKFLFFKITKLLKFINDMSKDYTHILFVDALDIAFTKPLNTIIEDFEKFECDILFCAEKGYWPNLDNYPNEYPNDTKLYLNSGAYIGKIEKIVDALKWLDTKLNWKKKGAAGYLHCDQGAWHHIHLDDKYNTKLDYDRKIFFSTYESKSEFNDEIAAYVIHDNGPFTENTVRLAGVFNK